MCFPRLGRPALPSGEPAGPAAADSGQRPPTPISPAHSNVHTPTPSSLAAASPPAPPSASGRLGAARDVAETPRAAFLSHPHLPALKVSSALPPRALRRRPGDKLALRTAPEATCLARGGRSGGAGSVPTEEAVPRTPRGDTGTRAAGAPLPRRLRSPIARVLTGSRRAGCGQTGQADGRGAGALGRLPGGSGCARRPAPSLYPRGGGPARPGDLHTGSPPPAIPGWGRKGGASPPRGGAGTWRGAGRSDGVARPAKPRGADRT